MCFIAGDTDEISNFSVENLTTSSLSAQSDTAIILPASLFKLIADDKDNISLFFIRYVNSTLFPVDGEKINTNASRRKEVGSNILAATVGLGSEIRDLEENVSVVFRLKIPEDKV